MSRPKTKILVNQLPETILQTLQGGIVYHRLPQLLLAGFLHVAPVCKALHTASSGLGASPAAIVLRWAAAVAAMAGAYHTVSAASAAIVGLTRYVNNTPQGGPTNNAVVMEGGVFRYRITVSNAGSDHNKDYFNCLPMPPGLTMNTNVGGNGFITNKPNASLVAGVYPVRLYAGNTSFPQPVTYDATITVLGTGTPPGITTHPADQTVTAGQSVTFTVVATGTALSYQWEFNLDALSGQTNATLTIGSASSAEVGAYTVLISNNLGQVRSNPAQLTVNPAPPLKLDHPRFENGSFRFDAAHTGANAYVLWASPDLSHWEALSTNTATSGVVQLSDPGPAREKRFYSVSTIP